MINMLSSFQAQRIDILASFRHPPPTQYINLDQLNNEQSLSNSLTYISPSANSSPLQVPSASHSLSGSVRMQSVVHGLVLQRLYSAVRCCSLPSVSDASGCPITAP